MAPLSGIALCTSIQFGLNELSKRLLQDRNARQGSLSPDRLSTLQYVLCGAIAGFGNAFISTPVEHIRIRMQNQANVTDPRLKFSGSYEALSKIYSQYGLRGVYKGLNITMLRDIISFGVFFGAYEVLKKKAFNEDVPNNLPLLMTLGAASGVLLWIATYPIDVCKTKFQSDSFSRPQFKSSLNTLYHILKHEGARGLTKGFAP